MTNRHKTNIVCDRNGNPLRPSDVSWRSALRRALIVLPLGAVLVPFGLLTYLFIELPSSVQGVRVLFGILLFLGVLFLLYGSLILVLSLVQRAKTPPRDEQIRSVVTEGESAQATVTEIKRKTVGKDKKPQYRVRAEYYDKAYRFKRVFLSDWTDVRLNVGDKVRVYYRADSNIGYYVEIPS